jgi:hypothetical protein
MIESATTPDRMGHSKPDCHITAIFAELTAEPVAIATAASF